MQPLSFSTISKNSLFQVYDKDALENSASFKFGAKDISYETKLVSGNNGAISGKVILNADLPSLTIKGFAPQAPRLSTTIESDPTKASSVSLTTNSLADIKDLNCTLTFSNSDKDLGSTPRFGTFLTSAFSLKRDNLLLNSAVTSDLSERHMVVPSASFGFDGYTVAGDAKLVSQAGDSSFAAKAYNVGFAFAPKRQNTIVAFTTDAKLAKAKLFATTHVPSINSVVGFQAKADIAVPRSNSQNEVILAWQKSIDAVSLSVATVIQTGVTRFGFDHTSADKKVTLSANAIANLPRQAFNPIAVQKFGVSLALKL